MKLNQKKRTKHFRKKTTKKYSQKKEFPKLFKLKWNNYITVNKKYFFGTKFSCKN